MREFVWDDFRNPPKRMLPMTRWWWPGLDVDEDELLRELDALDANGFAGAEIQAFTRGYRSFDMDDEQMRLRVHRFGTPFYFGLLARLMEACRKRGLLLELTTGSGWPMGDTRVTQETGMKMLVVGAVPAEGGGLRKVELPSPEEAVDRLFGADISSVHVINGIPLQVMDYPRMKRHLKLLRATIARVVSGKAGRYGKNPGETVVLDSESARDVTAFVEGGILDYRFPEGSWQVFAAYEGPSFQHVKSDAKEHPHAESFVLDHFAPGVLRHYLDRQIGRGELDAYAGDVLRAVFADSFELVGPWFWTDHFLTEFKRRRGYDLSPYLPVLMLPEEDNGALGRPAGCFDFENGLGERVRWDYERTLADMFCENFMEELTQWANERGMKSRVQCYGHVMDNLGAFGRADIPETEQLASSGFIDFMKVASSAALLYQKPIVSAESLVWPGRDYMETPMKMKIASDRLAVSGVNQMIYHGFSYRMQDAAWPGYFPWHNAHGSFISEANPVWPWIRQINQCIGRGQSVMQTGLPAVDVAIFCSNLAYDMKHGHLEKEELSTGVLDGIDRVDAGVPPIPYDLKKPLHTKWALQANGSRQLGIALQEAGYDYCHLNEECLLKAALRDETLCVGTGRFKALVLPGPDELSLPVAKKIAALRAEGFPVWFYRQVPQKTPGFKNWRENDKKLCGLLSGCRADEAGDIVQGLCGRGVLPGADTRGAAGLQHVRRRFEQGDMFFVRSCQSTFRSVTLTFPVESDSVELLDVWTGGCVRVPAERGGGRSTLTLPFVPYGSYFLWFGTKLADGGDGAWFRVLQASVNGEEWLDLSEDWLLTVHSALPGDRAPVLKRTRQAAGDWADDPELKVRSGTGIYEKTFSLDKLPDADVVLDLGMVGDIAEAELNGRRLGTQLALPYAFSVSPHLHAGENRLKITVTTTLRNGLIGTGALESTRQTAVSGLVGPVRLKLLRNKKERVAT